MAQGRPKAQQLAEAQLELREALDELETLKARVAIEAPQILASERHEPIRQYRPDLPDMIENLAEQGKTENMWLAVLGIDQSMWREWLDTFPELRAARARARVRLKGYLDRLQMRAVERGYSSFPAHVLATLRKELSDGDGDGGQGDASRFVRVVRRDRAPCPKCHGLAQSQGIEGPDA